MKTTNGLMSLIAITLIAIAWQLTHIKWAIRGEDPHSGKPKVVAEQIVEVIGLSTSTFDGLGSTTGYVIKMADGSLKEIPFTKVLGVTSLPHKLGDWKPRYFNVVIAEGGEITMACQTEINPL